ncbi:MAG: peptidyl-prolyl cis-trans isomerase [Planctomycetes bacterium]|nr:peptidyl-prolyl cis-trans isomerase [Planctomycetota bacterium]
MTSRFGGTIRVTGAACLGATTLLALLAVCATCRAQDVVDPALPPDAPQSAAAPQPAQDAAPPPHDSDPAAAQHAPPFVGPPLAPDAEASAKAEPQHSVAAMLNGQAITSGDIAFYAREITGQPGPYDDALVKRIRRTLAEHLLLAGEAERLGLKLTEYQVQQFYKDLFGSEPTYDDHADIAVDRQKTLVKKLIEQKIYEFHRLGDWDVFRHIIPPDPILKRQVAVTPVMVKSFFEDHRDEYDRPETVVYTVWPSAPENAASVRNALLAGQTPPQVRPIREEVADANLERVYSEALPALEFLQAAQPGDVSESWTSQTQRGPLAVCFRFEERRKPSQGDFSAEQEGIKQLLESRLREDAHRRMVDELLRDSRAVWLPKDLFDDDEATPAEPGRPG